MALDPRIILGIASGGQQGQGFGPGAMDVRDRMDKQEANRIGLEDARFQHQEQLNKAKREQEDRQEAELVGKGMLDFDKALSEHSQEVDHGPADDQLPAAEVAKARRAKGIDPSWTADPSVDWYRDKSGQLVSKSVGPKITPSGQLNTRSTEYLRSQADYLESIGVRPATVANIVRTSAAGHAAADKAELESDKLRRETEAKQQDIHKGALESATDIADMILEFPDQNEQGAFAGFAASNPGFANIIGEYVDDPNDWKQVRQVLTSLQGNSKSYADRLKRESDAAELALKKRTVAAQELTARSAAEARDKKGELSEDDKQLVEDLADQVANYTLDLRSITGRGANAQVRNLVTARAKELNPKYDQTRYQTIQRQRTELSSAGKTGQNLIAQGTAFDHLKQLETFLDPLNNTDVQALNQAKNWIAEEFGDSDVTNWKHVSHAVGTEVAKALVGGQTALADRQELMKDFDRVRSREQLQGVIENSRKLMAARVYQIARHSIGVGLPEDEVLQLLTPEMAASVESKLRGKSDHGEKVPAGDGKVKVRNKDGKVGMIPASQLKSALSQGYTEVK